MSDVQPYEIEYGSAAINATGTIDCRVRPPHLDLAEGVYLPFTASPDDPEPAGRDVHERVIAGQAGPIAPYEAGES